MKSESLSVTSNSLLRHGLYSPWNSPGQNTGVGSLFLLYGIFPTQGLNPGLLHYRRILYQLRKASGKEGVSGLEREGFGELGEGAGRTYREGIGETHFFTGILPSGLSCILSFTRLVGRKHSVKAQSRTLSPACTKARRGALTSCPGRCCGRHWPSADAWPEPVHLQPSPAGPQSTAVRSLTPEAAAPHSQACPLGFLGSPQGPDLCPHTHLAHVLLVGDEVMEGEVHHVRAGHHRERLQQEVVGDVHVEDFPELLALQRVVTRRGSAVHPRLSSPRLSLPLLLSHEIWPSGGHLICAHRGSHGRRGPQEETNQGHGACKFCVFCLPFLI